MLTSGDEPVANGDSVPSDISTLVRELTPSVFRLAARVVTDRDEAKDITQEAFVRTFTRSSGKALGNPRAYIYRTALNLAFNAKRRTALHDERAEDVRQALSQTDCDMPDTALEKRELAASIQSGLNDLPDRQREVLVLRFFADLRLREIAHVLDITEGTVKVHLARGLQGMRGKLNLQSFREAQ